MSDTTTVAVAERVHVSTETFVKAWVDVAARGGTAKDVAEITGQKTASVVARGKALVKKGAKLPTLTKNSNAVKVEDLNAMIAKLTAPATPEAPAAS